MKEQPSVSVSTLSRLWDMRDAMLLYIHMAICADKDGIFKVPPSRRLAAEVGITRYALGVSLEKLEKLGLISQESAKNQPRICVKINGVSTGNRQESTKNRPRINQEELPIMQDGYGRFLEYFNRKVEHTPIKQIRTLSDARKKALRSIFKEFGGKEVVEEALEKVVNSQWCVGNNDKAWVASFDWIFKKANFIKILEGNYDDRPKPISSTDNAASRKAQRDRGLSLATAIVARSENLLSLYDGEGGNPDARQN